MVCKKMAFWKGFFKVDSLKQDVGNSSKKIQRWFCDIVKFIDLVN